jgi:hypothetical protein
MRIDLLYVDGCPHHKAFGPRLSRLLQNRGIEANVNHVLVVDADQARRLRFLGSPSLQIDGCDVEPGAERRTDYGVQCRIYRYDGGTFFAPSDRDIVAAISPAERFD